jgi:hypothetical protein
VLNKKQLRKQHYSQVLWLKSVILAIQEAEIRRTEVQHQIRKILQETLSQKYPTQKSAGGVAQVVKCLPSKREALSSNYSNCLKKFKKKREKAMLES